MDIIKHLESRVQECQEAWDKAKQALADAQQAEQIAAKEYNLYQGALEAERRRTGRHAPTSQEPVRATFQLSPPKKNNTEYVREFIREHASVGVTPADVNQFIRKIGLQVNKAFGYTSLAKMKERGEVEYRDGRYFPARFGALQLQ